MRLPLGLVLALIAATAGRANVQCGANRTTCTGCHDDTRAASADDRPWHRDHGFADLCSACHGGHGDVEAVDRAHADLVEPLADVTARCGPCHGEASATLSVRYRTPPASTPKQDTSGRSLSPTRSTKHGEALPNVAMAVFLVAGAIVGGLLVRRDQRRIGTGEEENAR